MLESLSPIPVFVWEIELNHLISLWPHSGFIYEFFHACSDWSHSRWIVVFSLIGFFYWKGWRRALFFVAPLVIAVGLSDFISYHLVKAYFMRPRPHFLGQACTASACWGFISSHASNIVAASTVLTLRYFKNIYWTFPVAASVCFSRVYLGDHYALDVMGGMVLGFIIAILVVRSFGHFGFDTALEMKAVNRKQRPSLGPAKRYVMGATRQSI